jgi:uncharacterized protein YbaP (TraB family)
MISNDRSIILAAMLCIATSGAVKAKCQEHGILPPLRAKAPAVYAAIETAASEMPFRHGRLFRLSREGTEPSYLFGTLHLSDPRVVISFSPRVRAALAGSKIVVLESVETGDVLRHVIAKSPDAWRRATVADQDQRADRLLSKANFAQLEALVARKGLPESVAREFKPSTLALLLDSPDCAVPHGARPYVDELVADIAREIKIETIGLESMIEQIEVLNGLPHEIERDLLVAIVRQADHGDEMTEATVAPYVEGNIGDLLAWMRSAEPIPGVAKAQIPPAFLDRLITLRNYRMRDRALPILQRGGAFFAVGAAHLPGMDGLLSLLQKAGYDIETIE